MNKGVVAFCITVIALLLGIAVIDAGAKRPIDWSFSYNLHDKNPFGLYVLHQELGNMLSGRRDIQDFGTSIYEQLDTLNLQKNFNAAIVDIGSGYYLHEEDIHQMLKFVGEGGEVFLSIADIDIKLLDTLGIKTEPLDYYTFLPNDYDLSFSTVDHENRIWLEKNEDYVIFSKLNRRTHILGYLHVDTYDLPNFIAVSHGKGTFYFHLIPLALTNYNLLQGDQYEYASEVLNVMKKEQVFLYDAYFFADRLQTPLRVILSMKGLSHAWYLLLLGLVLLLIFKSRREQRAVPIIIPEPNLSKDFAKAIGSLYYESGQPGNIAKKKIDYFLFDLRQLFQIDTLDLSNRKMIYQLALKSGMEVQEVQDLMRLLSQYTTEAYPFTLEDVKIINNKIEEFKRKANIV